MISCFLGSWRSTVIIAISIPLAIFDFGSSFSTLWRDINIMILETGAGVGILVDDANGHHREHSRLLSRGKERKKRFSSARNRSRAGTGFNTEHLYVFVPMFCSPGSPLSLCGQCGGGRLAMLASYLLRDSHTTMAKYLLKLMPEKARMPSKNPLVVFKPWFDAALRGFEPGTRICLEACVRRRPCFCRPHFSARAFFLRSTRVGTRFFPSVDSCEFTLHLRARRVCD